MQRLINVIGKAPSELSFPDLVAKLTQERNRVRQALEHFRALPNKAIKKTKSRSSKSSDEKNIKKLIVSGKINKSKILELIKAAKSGNTRKDN